MKNLSIIIIFACEPFSKSIPIGNAKNVLSLLINKYFRHQKYNLQKQQLFGDWQTFKVFDINYNHDINNCCLSSRESKNGFMRFM